MNRITEEAISGRRLRSLLAIWFFVGMPLNMLLNWLYFFVGGSVPGILSLLSGLVYLSGGLLGIAWSREKMQKQQKILWEKVVVWLLLIVSVGFLFLGILFIMIGLRRL